MLKYIIKAIDYAHNKNIALSGYHGVLHLDIKPTNILISKSGDIKIIDFLEFPRGIIKREETKLWGLHYLWHQNN